MKILDLFCGAGGFSAGFREAGFKIHTGIDFNESAILTHDNNFPESEGICADLSTISNEMIQEKFKEIDGIIGGPPCQGFSVANSTRSIDDPRNKLFFEYFRFIEVIKPKFFVMENVQGILTSNKGYAKKEIIKIAEELGYKTTISKITASDFGVPQKRVRAFFVGIREDLKVEFDFSKMKPLFENTTVGEAIGDLFAIENNENHNTLTAIDNRTPLQEYYYDKNAEKIANHTFRKHGSDVIERIKHVQQGGNWEDVPKEMWEKSGVKKFSSAYRRLHMEESSVTIDSGRGTYFHPVFHRIPTARESARIQGFKDSFVFYGSVTDHYRQIGNAVSPIVAEAIARSLIEQLK